MRSFGLLMAGFVVTLGYHELGHEVESDLRTPSGDQDFGAPAIDGRTEVQEAQATWIPQIDARNPGNSFGRGATPDGERPGSLSHRGIDPHPHSAMNGHCPATAPFPGAEQPVPVDLEDRRDWSAWRRPVARSDGTVMEIHDPDRETGFHWRPAQDGLLTLRVAPGQVAWVTIAGESGATVLLDGKPMPRAVPIRLTGTNQLVAQQPFGVHVRSERLSLPLSSG